MLLQFMDNYNEPVTEQQRTELYAEFAQQFNIDVERLYKRFEKITIMAPDFYQLPYHRFRNLLVDLANSQHFNNDMNIIQALQILSHYVDLTDHQRLHIFGLLNLEVLVDPNTIPPRQRQI